MTNGSEIEIAASRGSETEIAVSSDSEIEIAASSSGTETEIAVTNGIEVAAANGTGIAVANGSGESTSYGGGARCRVFTAVHGSGKTPSRFLDGQEIVEVKRGAHLGLAPNLDLAGYHSLSSLRHPPVVSQAEEGGVKIVRLGNTKMLVSLNVGGPPGRVDHFAIGIPRFTRESITSYLIQRGATSLQGDLAGLHINDPDGVNVQIFSET